MARFKTGQVALNGSAQQLSAADGEYSAFFVKARLTNSGPVALGDSTVTPSTGFLLEPGETQPYGIQRDAGEPTMDVKFQDLYVAGTSGDTVSWLAHKL